jgi:hypothetical protein
MDHLDVIQGAEFVAYAVQMVHKCGSKPVIFVRPKSERELS